MLIPDALPVKPRRDHLPIAYIALRIADYQQGIHRQRHGTQLSQRGYLRFLGGGGRFTQHSHRGLRGSILSYDFQRFLQAGEAELAEGVIDDDDEIGGSGRLQPLSDDRPGVPWSVRVMVAESLPRGAPSRAAA